MYSKGFRRKHLSSNINAEEQIRQRKKTKNFNTVHQCFPLGRCSVADGFRMPLCPFDPARAGSNVQTTKPKPRRFSHVRRLVLLCYRCPIIRIGIAYETRDYYLNRTQLPAGSRGKIYGVLPVGRTTFTCDYDVRRPSVETKPKPT